MQYVIQKIGKLFGFSTIDGIFSPGGSISNMYAILLALHRRYPELRNCGLQSLPQKVYIFTSRHSHYSFSKASILMGLGLDQVVAIDCDEKGKMKPEDLEKKIQKVLEEGNAPIFVNATAGTTGSKCPIR